MLSGRAMKKAWKIWRAVIHAAQAPALRVRASFSQDCMTYVMAQDTSGRIAEVIYQSDVDSKTRFRYLVGYGSHFIDALICCTVLFRRSATCWVVAESEA